MNDDIKAMLGNAIRAAQVGHHVVFAVLHRSQARKTKALVMDAFADKDRFGEVWFPSGGFIWFLPVCEIEKARGLVGLGYWHPELDDHTTTEQIALVQEVFDSIRPPSGLTESKPDVRCGMRVITGTRITTISIYDLHRAGYSTQDIIEEYPTLKREDVAAAIEWESSPITREEFEYWLVHFREACPHAVPDDPESYFEHVRCAGEAGRHALRRKLQIERRLARSAS